MIVCTYNDCPNALDCARHFTHYKDNEDQFGRSDLSGGLTTSMFYGYDCEHKIEKFIEKDISEGKTNTKIPTSN